MSTYEYSGQDFLESLSDADHYNQALLDLLKPYVKPECKILDFGAGSGTFAKLMLKFMKEENHSVSAVEPDQILSSKLNAHGIPSFSSIDALQATDQYDLIYTLNVLEHINDDMGTARQLFQHLKPGGVLFIYVPAFQFLYSEFDQKIGHVRRYSRSRIEELGKSIPDSTVLKISYFDTMGFLAAWTFKLLRFGSEGVTAKKILFFDRWIFPLNLLMDRLFGHWIGKNLYLVIQKKS